MTVLWKVHRVICMLDHSCATSRQMCIACLSSLNCWGFGICSTDPSWHCHKQTQHCTLHTSSILQMQLSGASEEPPAASFGHQIPSLPGSSHWKQLQGCYHCSSSNTGCLQTTVAMTKPLGFVWVSSCEAGSGSRAVGSGFRVVESCPRVVRLGAGVVRVRFQSG